MDDLDYAWLRLYNSEHRVQKCLPEVSNKDFELLMDRLEKDSRLDPSVVANNLGSQGGGPGGVGGEEPEDDAVCSICQDGEANNTNVILFCDMCNLPVHQVCCLLCCWLISLSPTKFVPNILFFLMQFFVRVFFRLTI